VNPEAPAARNERMKQRFYNVGALFDQQRLEERQQYVATTTRVRFEPYENMMFVSRRSVATGGLNLPETFQRQH